jgi:hypothetical protein
MWLFTQFGFYSIVRKKDGIHVRGRVRKDLENLKNAAALQQEIVKWDGADYRYRMLVDDRALRKIMTVLADELDYDNFKNRVTTLSDQRAKLGAYHGVWGLMTDLQDSDHL